jgi:hypothetical protein
VVHASSYGEMAPLVADLVPALEQAAGTAANEDLAEAARELLSDTYQAVSALLFKLGETGQHSPPRPWAIRSQSPRACSGWPTRS